MKNYFITSNQEIIYFNFIINYSKNYKNKISVFYNNKFISDYNYISEAKYYINKIMANEYLNNIILNN